MLGLAGFIDTHSHIQLSGAPERAALEIEAARRAGVESMLLAPGAPGDWAPTRAFAHAWGLGYLLGIHPLFVKYADEAALARLRAEVEASLEDPFFIGIGEIGLDVAFNSFPASFFHLSLQRCTETHHPQRCSSIRI